MTVVDFDKKRGARKPPAEDWKSGLIASKEGTPKKCLANVLHVLAQHPAWQEVIAFDAFAEKKL